MSTSVFIADSTSKNIPVIDTSNNENTDFDYSDLTDLQLFWALDIIGIKESGLKNEYNIADTINNRPLTYVSSDELLSTLTPNPFLKLRTCRYAVKRVQIRHFRIDFSGRRIRQVWEQITGVIENFWIIFQKDYLTLLREKHMLSHPSPRGSLAIRSTVGQVVLVKEPGEPRDSWKLGRILHLDSREAVATVE